MELICDCGKGIEKLLGVGPNSRRAECRNCKGIFIIIDITAKMKELKKKRKRSV